MLISDGQKSAVAVNSGKRRNSLLYWKRAATCSSGWLAAFWLRKHFTAPFESFCTSPYRFSPTGGEALACLAEECPHPEDTSGCEDTSPQSTPEPQEAVTLLGPLAMSPVGGSEVKAENPPDEAECPEKPC